MKPKARSLRSLPAVEKVLQALGQRGLPRPVTVAIVRRELGAFRRQKSIPAFEVIMARVKNVLEAIGRSRIQPVINGTGILVHTNLGRAPLAASAVEALCSVASSYNNLEYDLATGGRGQRAGYLESNLAVLCGAEAATVTNNCAAALLLILRHFARAERKEVVISRGELVQIGGGFRIPEILEAAGAALREVGTTNKTTLGDYARALGPHTAMILKVHHSNFFMGGFTESPSRQDLGALARRKRVPFIEDLGSGAVLATEKMAALEHEPTVVEVLKAGADLVCFSGDKLLGGPQAGIIAGRAKLVAALKREPFFRALRCDKLILSALQATVDLYLSGAAEESVPILVMLRASNDELRIRASRIVAALAGLPLETRAGEGAAQVGGGTLPRSVIASVTVELRPAEITVGELAIRLRQRTPPVIGYLSGGVFKLDLRTVFPDDDGALVAAVHAVLDPVPQPVR